MRHKNIKQINKIRKRNEIKIRKKEIKIKNQRKKNIIRRKKKKKHVRTCSPVSVSWSEWDTRTSARVERSKLQSNQTAAAPYVPHSSWAARSNWIGPRSFVLRIGWSGMGVGRGLLCDWLAGKISAVLLDWKKKKQLRPVFIHGWREYH
jgi:hypothetical protein